MSSSKEKINKAVDNLLRWCKIRTEAIQREEYSRSFEEAVELSKILNILNPNADIVKQDIPNPLNKRDVMIYNDLMYSESLKSLLYLIQNKPSLINTLKKIYFENSNLPQNEDDLRTRCLMQEPCSFYSDNDIKEIEHKRYVHYMKNLNSKKTDSKQDSTTKTKSIKPFKKWKIADRKDCPAFPQYYPNPFTYWWTLEMSKIWKAVGGGLRYHYNKYKKSIGESIKKKNWRHILMQVITNWISNEDDHTKFTTKLVVRCTIDMIRLREKYMDIMGSPEENAGIFTYEHQYYNQQDIKETLKSIEGDWDYYGFIDMVAIIYNSIQARPLDPKIHDKVLKLLDIIYNEHEENIFEDFYNQELHGIEPLVKELIALDNQFHHEDVEPKYKDDWGFVRTMVPTELW